MDEHRRLLERRFHQDREYETACKLIHIDWSLGIFNLREQAARFDLNYEDAWDCANFYPLGRTQTLVDAISKALDEEASGAIQSEIRDAYLNTNRSGPDSLLREVNSMANANMYYRNWNISIRNVDTRLSAGPEDVIRFSIEDDPLYRPMPSLMITGVTHQTGSSNTIGIYVQDLNEIPRIVHALHLIALMIHGNLHYPANWRDVVGFDHRTIDEVETSLREMNVLHD